MARTNNSTEDLAAKLADLGRAGSTAMQPAVNHAMAPVEEKPRSAKSKGRVVQILVKATMRFTHEEILRLIRFRNELSERHGQALNTTDVMRLALNMLDCKHVTPEIVHQIKSTDRRRRAD